MIFPRYEASSAETSLSCPVFLLPPFLGLCPLSSLLSSPMHFSLCGSLLCHTSPLGCDATLEFSRPKGLLLWCTGALLDFLLSTCSPSSCILCGLNSAVGLVWLPTDSPVSCIPPSLNSPGPCTGCELSDFPDFADNSLLWCSTTGTLRGAFGAVSVVPTSSRADWCGQGRMSHDRCKWEGTWAKVKRVSDKTELVTDDDRGIFGALEVGGMVGDVVTEVVDMTGNILCVTAVDVEPGCWVSCVVLTLEAGSSGRPLCRPPNCGCNWPLEGLSQLGTGDVLKLGPKGSGTVADPESSNTCPWEGPLWGIPKKGPAFGFGRGPYRAACFCAFSILWASLHWYKMSSSGGGGGAGWYDFAGPLEGLGPLLSSPLASLVARVLVGTWVSPDEVSKVLSLVRKTNRMTVNQSVRNLWQNRMAMTATGNNEDKKHMHIWNIAKNW